MTNMLRFDPVIARHAARLKNRTHDRFGRDPEELDHLESGGAPQVRNEVQENLNLDHQPDLPQVHFFGRRRDDVSACKLNVLPEHEVSEVLPDTPLETAIGQRHKRAPSARTTAVAVQGASTSSRLRLFWNSANEHGEKGSHLTKVKRARMSSGLRRTVAASGALYRDRFVGLPPQLVPTSQRRIVVSAKGKLKAMELEELPEEDAGDEASDIKRAVSGIGRR
ncbi:uncharacterized protein EDB91DRAFT_1252260 [Suillus paluster]|uniref:uncharacterized protein n=1 Tax=Suillus paluster TaxID=48578 RepID=UPI001B86DFBF|nr:uncharacterized protein EDB91DRAFT_1252260 [Suillus paluster]KAG1731197.1 hypothetical protein EDB91DRAFT_1252260 [Suillus paluster]